jgi:hypothetical protein
VLAAEVLSQRSNRATPSSEFLNDDKAISALLEEFASLLPDLAGATPISNSLVAAAVRRPTIASSAGSESAASSLMNKLRPSIFVAQPADGELSKLKNQNLELSLEVGHLRALLEQLKSQLADVEDKQVRTSAEREYFRMKLAKFSPEKTDLGGAELESSVSLIEGYMREIEMLRTQLMNAHQRVSETVHGDVEVDGEELALEQSLGCSVARVIAQTKASLYEEQHRIREMLTGGSKRLEDEGGGDISAGREELEQQEAAERRQRILTTEVVELSQSIQLKEQLLEQLVLSQQQYAAMKSFYEERLEELNRDLNIKENEREKLMSDLEVLANKATTGGSKEKENELRNELKRRDGELQELRKSQKHLNHLTTVQSRATQQMGKLEEEIRGMKCQRVELARTLQLEKKAHLTELKTKMTEIERLKRELSKTASEARNLKAVNERTDGKLKQVMKEGIALRKKNTELQHRPTSAPSASAAQQTARGVLGGMAKRAAAPKMSDSELRTKSWLDRRITRISQQERDVDDLRRQCDKQLLVVHKREVLDSEKGLLRKAIAAVDDESMQGAERDALQEVEDRIDSLNTELAWREGALMEAERRLTDKASADGGKEATMELLRREGANTLSGAQVLVKLLFDMLCESRAEAMQLRANLVVRETRERELQRELEESTARAKSAQRAHEIAFTSAASEYEEKLSGLFNYSDAGRLINAMPMAEDEYSQGGVCVNRVSPRRASSARAALTAHLRSSISSTTAAALSSPYDSIIRRQPSTPNSIPITLEETELESQLATVRSLLKVSSEQVKAMRHSLDMESYQCAVVRGHLEEASAEKERLVRELADRDVLVRYLEEEVRLFRGRDMAEPSPITDSTAIHIPRIGVAERKRSISRSDEEEDEFRRLVEEINRLGNGTGGSFSSRSINREVKDGPRSIHERLADPSQFTGAQRAVFTENSAKVAHLIRAGVVSRKVRGGLDLSLVDNASEDDNMSPSSQGSQSPLPSPSSSLTSNNEATRGRVPSSPSGFPRRDRDQGVVMKQKSSSLFRIEL